ncbi:MAG: type I glutamate--ammonia ligase [Pseudoclavibacter sp.]
MDKQTDFVLRTIEERDVRFVRLWFTDIVGSLKSVAISPAEVEGAFTEGLGFDGSTIEGFTRAFESDMLANPDASTFQLLPWRGSVAPAARMFCDITLPDGQPAASDPRYVLKRALAHASDLGFSFYTHPEIEFYVLEKAAAEQRRLVPIDRSTYFDNDPGGPASDFRRRAITMLEDLGISVEFSHHEVGPGQSEIDLRYADALTMADNIMTFRTVIKEVASEQGVFATFMPKPFPHEPGSGMHTHVSLFEGDNNAFFDAGAEYRLSRTGRQFTAGLLAHAAEISAVTNQFVNSYKRLWGGDEAPSYVSWGHSNHSALVRVPLYKPTKTQSARVEYRAIDAACNPYLAYALLLMAGLDGIERGLELPAEAEDNIWNLSDEERAAMGFAPLPETLEDALKVMRDSELVADTLGEQVFNFFLLNKRKECAEYRSQVTQFELENYLNRF